jgi:hyperosmotically inducible periplasmic protein
MKTPKIRWIICAGAATLLASAASAQVQGDPMAQALPQKVRHELVRLPFLSVFDSLSYRVDPGGVVTLLGEVTRPTLKSDAGRAVSRIEGVARVVNEVEVLPLSNFDDRIRLATYGAIYGYGPLQRYRLGALPAIRIIVKNGHVALEGVVGSEMDRNLANIRANQVPGVFSVTNELVVSRS